MHIYIYKCISTYTIYNYLYIYIVTCVYTHIYIYIHNYVYVFVFISPRRNCKSASRQKAACFGVAAGQDHPTRTIRGPYYV